MRGEPLRRGELTLIRSTTNLTRHLVPIEEGISSLQLMVALISDDLLIPPLLLGVIPIVLLILPFMVGVSGVGHRWRLLAVARVLRRWMVPITVAGEAGTVFPQALLVVTRVFSVFPSQQLLLLGGMSTHLGVSPS